MTDVTHDVHGLAGNCEPAQWPALRFEEVNEIGAAQRINWHSPRPLSAACLVQCTNAIVFVKRHHCTVRTVATLEEEHRFIDHLRAVNMPVPAVLRDRAGRSARAIGDWVYEVHACAAGSHRSAARATAKAACAERLFAPTQLAGRSRCRPGAVARRRATAPDAAGQIVDPR